MILFIIELNFLYKLNFKINFVDGEESVIIKRNMVFVTILIFSLVMVLGMSVVSATEGNNSINTTNNSQTLTEDTSDNQTLTANQTDPTTDTETKYAAAGSVTFTQDQIIEASSWVQEYIETNQELPDYVTINGIYVNMPSFLELLTTVTQRIYNKDTRNVEYIKCNAPTSPKDNQQIGTISKSTYILIAGKVQRYMDRYLIAPNYSSYSSLGTYFGYQNLVYTYSKVLNTYNSTGSLPANVRIVPWSYVVNFAGSFTIGQTVEAAGWVREYVETNQKLPTGVPINGTNLRGDSITTTLNMPTFLKLLTTVTQKIYKKDTTATSITGNYKTASSPKDNQKTGTMSLASYVSIAGRVQRYMDRYLIAPNYSSYSSLGKYFGYQNLIYTYSKVLNTYNSTGSLPANIKVMPWNLIVNFAGSFTIGQTVEAAGWVREYVETNQKLPTGVPINGTNLRGDSITTTLNMPTFLNLLTTITQKIYKNDLTPATIAGNYKTATSSKDLIHSGSMSLATYVSVAGRVQRYMDRYLIAPSYSSYSGLGKYFGYQNLIYTYSKIMNTYNSTGSLPATFAAVPWNKFTIDQVADAATYVKNYVNNNHKLPSYVTINGIKVGMSSFLLILTTAVDDINDNGAGSVYYNYCSSTSSYDSQSSGSMNLDKYSDIAGRVQRYMERYWKAPKYSSYSNLGRYFGYYNMVYTFSRVMAYYDQYDTLPSSVGVGPWWGTVTSLGSTSYGKVVKIGPFGNRDSSVKIAYIIGVHPLESVTHQAFLSAIKKYDTSLDYCYYVYKVTVTKYASNYERGRMNGQLLAKYLVVPNIKKNKFKLAVDVHNNIGSWAKNKFIFSPVSGTKSQTIAWKIKNKISWLSYYTPPYSTSPQYVTIPLIRSGIPAVVVELYHYSSYGTQCNQMNQFVQVVDSLSY
jgi:ribulose-5-phosphate 4-epimerase/fuculose-1-phosphate aldolase